MSTHFFTNDQENTLINKFEKTLNQQKLYIEILHAVSGYFHSSAYFKIQPYLENLKEIKIIVGIKADDLTHQLLSYDSLNFNEENEEFKKKIIEEFQNAQYSQETEKSISDFLDDIISERLQLRLYNKKNLHAKFYLLLPNNYNEYSGGSIIMGSSNLTEAGLGMKIPSNYELNVELRDFEDVQFGENEFQKLWKESIPFPPNKAQELKEILYLDQIYLPHDLYIKLLIETCGDLEDDNIQSNELPEPYSKISYQGDAVNEGFKMLEKHNGFFLADVVGLGKTIVAAMIARRFIRENHGKANILVVFPPALRENWEETFKNFNLKSTGSRIDFISGSNLKLVFGAEKKHTGYAEKEQYDLIIVDEAHKFKVDTSQKFADLQTICKSNRPNGMGQKKVILISATPFNNNPRDIYNLLCLFQDKYNSTLSTKNIEREFQRYINKYNELLKEDPKNMDSKEKRYVFLKKMRDLMKPLRESIIYEITVRRTRTDILSVERYRKDLEEQGIQFPDPTNLYRIYYNLGKNVKMEFYTTLSLIVNRDNEGLGYYRHRMIEFLKPEHKNDLQYAKNSTDSLVGIMKTMMIKRLESSFEAFRITVENFLKSTQTMIKLIENNRAVVASNEDIQRIQDVLLSESDEDVEQDIVYIDKLNKQTYKQTDFEDGFLEKMKKDAELLSKIQQRWIKVQDKDPKIEICLEKIKNEMLNPTINPSGKLLIFTEYNDTANYLDKKLKENLKENILKISSENRARLSTVIQENFDENIDPKQKKDDYQILISTDVLGEGVNLHRSNVIFNYDTPWNPIKLIQRVGRINRIGTKATKIYNYIVYPSKEGDEEITLEKKSLAKSQGFHTLLGEDSAIYSPEELKEEYELSIEGKEEKNNHLIYAEELRGFKMQYPEEFERIKEMMPKAKTGRKYQKTYPRELKNSTIAFLKANEQRKYYQMTEQKKLIELNKYKLLEYFKAEKEEIGHHMQNEKRKEHDEAIQVFQEYFKQQLTEEEIANKSTITRISKDNGAIKWLRAMKQLSFSLEKQNYILQICDELIDVIEKGTYKNVTAETIKLKKMKMNSSQIIEKLTDLHKKFVSPAYKMKEEKPQQKKDNKIQVIVAETFID